MAERCGFFNSTDGDIRTYCADDFKQVLSGFLTDGVVGLLPEKTGSLTLRVGEGTALIDGHWYRNTADWQYTVSPTTDGGSRTDWIVLRYDKNAKTIGLLYREAPSELYDNTSYKEIKIANVFVAPAYILSIQDQRQAIALKGVN